MKSTIARKMIDMSTEVRTLGSMPGATRSEIITRSSSLAAIHHLRESTILFRLSRLAVGSRNSRSGDCWRGASDVNEEQIEWPRHAVEIQRVDEEGRVAGLP